MVDNIDKSLDLGGKPELEILKSETEVEIDGQPIPTPEGVDIEIDEQGGAILDFDPMKTLPDEVEIYVDNWFTLYPTQEANYYLSDDVPLDKQSTFTVPIHQRTDSYTLRLFSNSPFPMALTSCSWEGTYSPRYYRRT